MASKIFDASPETWQDLEIMVQQAFDEMGYESHRKYSVKTVRGSVEVDVYAKKTTTPIPSIVICECKHWNTLVSKNVIHGFRTVCSDIGAHYGLVISKKGFQIGAEGSRESTNVHLLTFEEFQPVGRISRRRNPPTAAPEQPGGGLRFANPPYALFRLPVSAQRPNGGNLGLNIIATATLVVSHSAIHMPDASHERPISQELPMDKITAKFGAALYVCWGLLHFTAAYGVYQLARNSPATMTQGRLMQTAFYLAAFATTAIVLAITLNWRNDRLGLWVSGVIVGIADIPFILFVLIPGYAPWWPGLLGPLLWVAAFFFTGLARMSATRPVALG